MKSIKDSVALTVKKYKSRNPFEIIKGMKNVILVTAPLSGVRGFYQYYKRNYIIYIDENLTYNEKMFVCSHELGHLILHNKCNHIYMDTKTNFNTNKYEIEANRFAVELLIPDSILVEYSDYSISQLSRLLGYEENLIKLRLNQCNI